MSVLKEKEFSRRDDLWKELERCKQFLDSSNQFAGVLLNSEKAQRFPPDVIDALHGWLEANTFLIGLFDNKQKIIEAIDFQLYELAEEPLKERKYRIL